MAHGLKTTVWIETTPGSGTKPPTLAPAGYFAVTKAHSAHLTLGKDLADANVFGDSNALAESGLKNGGFTADVRYNTPTMAVLLAAYNSETPVSIVYRPEGDVSGKYQFWADYHIDSIDNSGDTGSVTGGSVSFKRNGAIAYAVIA